MFGSKKIMTQILENMKIQTQEQVKKTDLMIERNELLGVQNRYLKVLARATYRIDKFNRAAYEAQMGGEVGDEKSLKKFQEFEKKKREAEDELYFASLSITGEETGEEEL